LANIIENRKGASQNYYNYHALYRRSTSSTNRKEKYKRYIIIQFNTINIKTEVLYFSQEINKFILTVLFLNNSKSV